MVSSVRRMGATAPCIHMKILLGVIGVVWIVMMLVKWYNKLEDEA